MSPTVIAILAGAAVLGLLMYLWGTGRINLPWFSGKPSVQKLFDAYVLLAKKNGKCASFEASIEGVKVTFAAEVTNARSS